MTISELELLDIECIENFGPWTLDVGLKVSCSAGTYIRTLAEDIGRVVGVGAHLAELRRTAAGKFSIDSGRTIEQLADLADPTTELIPMTDAVSHLAKFTVPDDRIGKTRNGLSTRVFDTGFVDGDAIQMLSPNGELIAIGFFDATENVVQPKVVLV